MACSGVLKRAAAIWPATAMPTELATPWPSGPVVASTPGVIRNSGWPGVMLCRARNFAICSIGISKPHRCSQEYRNMLPWPAERTNRSRFIHRGLSGFMERACPKSTAPSSAQPRGRPRWPEEQARTASIASPRASLAAFSRMFVCRGIVGKKPNTYAPVPPRERRNSVKSPLAGLRGRGSGDGLNGPPRLHVDGDGRLSCAVAQVVEARPHRLGLALDLDGLDVGRVNREHALDPLAVADPAHREGLVDARPLAGDHDAGEDLDPLLVALAHLRMHPHAVADLEGRYVALHLGGGDFLDDRVHGVCLVCDWLKVT